MKNKKIILSILLIVIISITGIFLFSTDVSADTITLNSYNGGTITVNENDTVITTESYVINNNLIQPGYEPTFTLSSPDGSIIWNEQTSTQNINLKSNLEAAIVSGEDFGLYTLKIDYYDVDENTQTENISFYYLGDFSSYISINTNSNEGNYYNDSSPSSFDTEYQLNYNLDSSLTLEMYIDGSIETLQNDNSTHSLSDLITSTGNKTISYKILDGATTLINKDLTNISFIEYGNPSTTGNITGVVDGVYYTGDVENPTMFNISLNKTLDNTSVNYDVYYDSNLIGNYSGNKNIDLSSLNLDGTYELKTVLHFDQGLDIEKSFGSYTFKSNSASIVSGESIVSAKGSTYYYGLDTNDNVSTKVNLNVSDTDNVDKLILEILSDGSVIKTYNGSDAAQNITLDISKLILSSGNHEITYRLSDGIYNDISGSFGTYNFVRYELPSISGTFTGGILGSYYTNYVSNSNITNLNITPDNGEGNTNISYEIYNGADLIGSYTTANSINLSSYNNVGNYLDGNINLSYVIKFDEGSDILGNFGSQTFVENTPSNISNINLISSAADGKFYTGDVRSSMRSEFSYDLTDAENNVSTNCYIYNSNVAGQSEANKVNLLSDTLGSFSYDISNLNYEGLESFSYKISDGIGDDITGEIGDFNFIKNTAPIISTSSVLPTYTANNNIFFGDVKESSKTILKFEVEKYDTIYTGSKDLDIDLNIANKTWNESDILLFENGLNLSDLSGWTEGNTKIQVLLDDNIADVQTFYINNNSSTSNLGSAWDYEVLENKTPVFNASVNIPVENSGIIYTHDVRNSKQSNITVDIFDDFYISSNLYDVKIDGVSTYQGINTETIHNLTSSNFNGVKSLEISVDDGIADPYTETVVGFENLTFLENLKPVISNLDIENSFDGKIYYKDVNISDKMATISFNSDENVDYRILYKSEYGAEVDKTLVSSLFNGSIGTEKTTNTLYDYSHRVGTDSLVVELDDGVSDLVTMETGSYIFLENTKPSISNNIDYGISNKGTDYKSVFQNVDGNSFTQIMESSISDDLYNENFNFRLYQDDVLKATNLDTGSKITNFNFTTLNNFEIGLSTLKVLFDDGIYEDFVLITPVKFTQTGKPTVSLDITGAYEDTYIYNQSMDETFAGVDYFNGINFNSNVVSSNEELELLSIDLEYEINNSGSWNTITDGLNPLYNTSDLGVVSKEWFNNTGNNAKTVKFRLSLEDEIGQTAEAITPEYILSKEYNPVAPFVFLMYEGEDTTPGSYTLEVGKQYRFEWNPASDINTVNGDEIVKYYFSYQLDSNPEVITEIANTETVHYFDCVETGNATFSIWAVDKFGNVSNIKSMTKDSISNDAPNDINTDTISSTYTTGFENLEYIKAGENYVLSFVNAGDENNIYGDYVTKWLIEYSPDNVNWYTHSYVNNDGNKWAKGETVSFNYSLNNAVLDGKSQIFFRITPFDRDNVPSVNQSISGSYLFTYDMKKPVWDNIGDLSFNSSTGLALDLTAIIKDDSNIAYITINGQEVLFTDTVDGATFDFTTYKNGNYIFRIGDIYGNEYLVAKNVSGVDAIIPSVSFISSITGYTNEAYTLGINASDSLTGLDKIEIDFSGLDGSSSHFETSNEFVSGDKEFTLNYLIDKPGTYKVLIYDLAGNIKEVDYEAFNINLKKPILTETHPSTIQDKVSTININVEILDSNIYGSLGELFVLESSTLKNYGELTSLNNSNTSYSLDVFENGTLNLMYTDVFGNDSDVLQIDIENVLNGTINYEEKYLMKFSEYSSDYIVDPNIEHFLLDGTDYIVWNNLETTNTQLYGYLDLDADFEGLQFASFDKERNGSNITYFDDENALLYKFNDSKKAFYVLDIFDNYTQIVMSINGYVAPPPCEITYEILNKELTNENVKVYFEIAEGEFTNSDFYADGVYDSFKWGFMSDGEFVEDNSYKLKSFLYEFSENGSFTVWGQSTNDNTIFTSSNVTIFNIDKTKPTIEILDFDSSSKIADSITLKATTNGEFITKEEFVSKIQELGYGLTNNELDSYTLSEDKKEASLTIYHNVSGIFFYAKSLNGETGNSENIKIENIYTSNLAMDLFVYFEDGTSITYEEYKEGNYYTSENITVKAISSNTNKDENGDFILREFKAEDNPGAIITNTSYQDGGNLTTASYTFDKEGYYTFVLKDELSGILERTVEIGNISSNLPIISISKENIQGEDVPYTVSVLLTITTDNEDTYILDEDGNSTGLNTKQIKIIENGDYTFKAIDKYGNIGEQVISITNIFNSNSNPIINATYNTEYTNESVMVTMTVSNGKFINIPDGWIISTKLNNGAIIIKKEFIENEEEILYATSFSEDEDKNVSYSLKVENIDKVSPEKPFINYSVDIDGKLKVVFDDNGDDLSGINTYSYILSKGSLNKTETVGENNNIITIDTKLDETYDLNLSVSDNAGNNSPLFETEFSVDNKKVEDFMSTYNSIITGELNNDTIDFYNDLINNHEEELINYSNSLQKEFISEKIDLLRDVISSGTNSDLILINRIDNYLKELALNPSDLSFIDELKTDISSLTNLELQKSYNLELNNILNNNDILSIKSNASSEFNYVDSLGNTLNPLSGIVLKNNQVGHYNLYGAFVSGIDDSEYYYNNIGDKIILDLTYGSFVDSNKNTVNTSNGLINESFYYDIEGNSTDSKPYGGFYTEDGKFHSLNWNGGINKEGTFIVSFVDYNDSLISSIVVNYKESAIAPDTPEREGYVFTGWDKDFSEVRSDLVVKALYVDETSNNIPITEILLSKSVITMKLGTFDNLGYEIIPSEATNKNIYWSSSNSSIATITDGLIKAVGIGSCEITIQNTEGIKNICKVSVITDEADIEDNVVILPSVPSYETIEESKLKTTTVDKTISYEVPYYYVGYLGSLKVGYTNKTDFETGNLIEFFKEGYSTLLYDNLGYLDISNKRNSDVNLGLGNNDFKVFMHSQDIDNTYYINNIKLESNNGVNLYINNNITSNSGLGNNSYLLISSDYNDLYVIKRNGISINTSYSNDLGGYVIYNPYAGSYVISEKKVYEESNLNKYDFSSEEEISSEDTISYKTLIIMAYNALNKDTGGTLYSTIDKSSEIYREASILQKYGIIESLPSNIYASINGSDAYSILYNTLSQTTTDRLVYNIASYQNRNTLTLEDINDMIESILN